MLDLVFIALVVVFFAVAFWYARFCERVSWGESWNRKS